MLKVGVLSDTHGYLDDRIKQYLKGCDEIWHAGDIGAGSIVEELQKMATLRAVYGNIDGWEIRSHFPEIQNFSIDQFKVIMIHIGGYPKRYEKGVKPLLLKEKPNLFISGHSHILKVIYDTQLNLLHINPGAAGKQGFQAVRTLIRFQLVENEIKNMEVIEMKR